MQAFNDVYSELHAYTLEMAGQSNSQRLHD